MIKISKFACVSIFPGEDWCHANSVPTRVRLVTVDDNKNVQELVYPSAISGRTKTIDVIYCFGYFYEDEWRGEVFWFHRLAAPAIVCRASNKKYYFFSDIEYVSQESYLEKLDKDQKLKCILSEEFLNDW